MPETRVLAGFAVPTFQGVPRPTNMKLFRYHENVVGKSTFEAKKKEELSRCQNLLKNGYDFKKRYPGILKNGQPRWEKVLEDRVSRQFTDVTKMQDHVISEVKRIFKGSDQEHIAMIYHDPLKQWWEPGAQKHMFEQGFYHRQVMGGTLVRHYKGRTLGDRPGLMPGDTNLHRDIKYALRQNAIRYFNSFDLSTPDRQWNGLQRIMQHFPTPERIQQDCYKWRDCVNAIVAAEGGPVNGGVDGRHGRRARHAQGGNGQVVRRRKVQFALSVEPAPYVDEEPEELDEYEKLYAMNKTSLVALAEAWNEKGLAPRVVNLQVDGEAAITSRVKFTRAGRIAAANGKAVLVAIIVHAMQQLPAPGVAHVLVLPGANETDSEDEDEEVFGLPMPADNN